MIAPDLLLDRFERWIPDAAAIAAEAELLGVEPPPDWATLPAADKIDWLLMSRLAAVGHLQGGDIAVADVPIVPPPPEVFAPPAEVLSCERPPDTEPSPTSGDTASWPAAPGGALPWWLTCEAPSSDAASPLGQIAVSTVDRSPAYIHETLAALAATDGAALWHGARLVVSGTDGRYLDRWCGTGDPPCRVEVIDDETWRRDWEPRSRKHRTALNFRRILRGAHPDLRLVALQDDLAFAEGWLMRAADIADRIEREREHERYVLALYASYRFKSKPYYGYAATRFYGNQALLLPPATHAAMLAFFEAEMGAGRFAPDDMMVKQFLIESGTPLFAANPNLVQHVGFRSAVEDRFHKSPSFEGPR